MTRKDPIVIETPLIAMFKARDGDILCDIYPSDHAYQDYGLRICDLVRTVAGAFEVDEDAVWEWVDKERRWHTSELIAPS